MGIQLTAEQQQRILAVVQSGAYVSPEEALDAAVAAVETAAAPGFAGTPEELVVYQFESRRTLSLPLTACEFE